MKKVRKKIIFSLFGLSLLLSPGTISADGMVIEKSNKSGKWDYSTEKSQQAFISLANGRENMIVSIDMEESNGSDRFWILPVPANPEKTTIDIVSSLPYFNGNEVVSEAKSYIRSVGDTLLNSQLYPIAYRLIKYLYFPQTISQHIYTGSPTLGGIAGGTVEKNDVNVYDKASEFGITTELVTAKTKDGLYNYLNSKGLDIKADSLKPIDSYLGKDYCFAVSWMSDVVEITRETTLQIIRDHLEGKTYYRNLDDELYYIERDNPEIENFVNQKQNSGDKATDYNDMRREYLEIYPEVKELLVQKILDNPEILIESDTYPEQSNIRGLFLSFPTERLYFPLKPTSAYGSTEVPATIRVLGDFKPIIYRDIIDYTETEYYRSSYRGAILNAEKLNIGYNDLAEYTKITLDPPSKLLSEDLWFEPGISIKAMIFRTISKNIWLFGVVYFLLLSILSAVAASLLVFKESRSKNIFKYALVGAFNIFTLAGFIIATVFWPTKQIQEEDQELERIMRQKGHSTNSLMLMDTRKFLFVPVFSVIFLLINWIIMLCVGSYT